MSLYISLNILFREGGIMKFDGTNWKLFTPQNSDIPGSLTSDIITDEQNNKWATINLTNEIKILTAFEDGTTLKSNMIRPYSAYSNLATNECAIYTNGDKLWVRLGKQIDSSFVNKEISIQFKMVTASNEGVYTFNTTVEGKLFDPVINKQTNYSTCGPQNSSATVIFSVIIASECPDVNLVICSIAPSTPSTTFIFKIFAKYSVS